MGLFDGATPFTDLWRENRRLKALASVLADELERHEWVYDDNPSSNCCWTCGAVVKGKTGPFEHKEGCDLKWALDEAVSLGL